MGVREYVLPDGGVLPLHSLPGWCQDCGRLEDIENLDPNQWLIKITAIKEQIASVQAQKRLCGLGWTYAQEFFGHMSQGQVTNETFSVWAQELNQAVIGFRVISDRKSPARCLSCGSERVAPAEYFSDPDNTTARKLIHPGCGGVLEYVIEGDIFIPNRSLRIRRYSLDGEFLGWFEDDHPRIGHKIWNIRDPWYQKIIDYLDKRAD